MNKWINAFRIRTLPLALSSILLGGFIALEQGYTNPMVLTLAVLTTLFLQVLSNLANDYGDFLKGTDNDNRVGPKRAMQSGLINKSSMKKAILILVLLSLISGISLVYVSFGKENVLKSLLFILLGVSAILASIRYTVGKKAYGYSGLGDVFVFLFFGWVAVIGTYFLISLDISYLIFLPATTLGLFSTGVLNLNNLRDYKNDEASGKRTIVVKIGYDNARVYHMFLILGGWLSFLSYLLLIDASLSVFIVLLSLPLFVMNLLTVFKVKDEKLLDPELKKLALSITLFTLLFGLGVVFG